MIEALLVTAAGAALVIWITRDLRTTPVEPFDQSPHPKE